MTDEAVMLHTQYSTHWDGFPHKGSLFDADGDGVPEKVFYNGYRIVDAGGRGTQGKLGAVNLSVAGMAATGVQGRGVMIDLHHYVGDERVEVGYDKRLLEWVADTGIAAIAADNLAVERSRPCSGRTPACVTAGRRCRCTSTACSSWGSISANCGT